MRHHLLGVVPVARASGPDIDRSAAARHTSEIIWAPAAALAHVAWYAADDRHVTLLVPCGGRMYRPTLTVADSGAVLRVSIPRWTDMGREGWHEESFTALLGRERTFGGYTVPTRTTAGWGYGTARWEAGGAFIRQRIDSARYL